MFLSAYDILPRTYQRIQYHTIPLNTFIILLVKSKLAKLLTDMENVRTDGEQLHPIIWKRCRLPEPGRAATHDLALANKLCVEFGSVEGEVDVEIHAVECALGCVHAFEVLLEVFAREI